MTQREIEAHGCHVERRGQAWSITGQGISLLVVDLKMIQPRDLVPVRNDASTVKR